MQESTKSICGDGETTRSDEAINEAQQRSLLLKLPSEIRTKIWRHAVEYGQELFFCPRRFHPDDALGPYRERTCLSPRIKNPLLGLFLLNRQCFTEIRPLRMLQYTGVFCCIECAIEWIQMARIDERAKFDKFDVFAIHPCDGKTCRWETTINSSVLPDADGVMLSEFLIETGMSLAKLEPIYRNVEVVKAFTFEAGMVPRGIFGVGKPISATEGV